MLPLSPEQRPSKPYSSPALRLPRLCAALAGVLCVVVLAGWMAGSPRIAGFGSLISVMQPLTATACLGLAAALWFALSDMRLAATACLTLPAAIALLALFQNATGSTIGIDRLLFHDTVSGQMRPAPGRPGPTVCAAILLLACATLAAMRGTRRSAQLVILLAGIASAIALVAGSAGPLGFAVPGGRGPHLLMAIPTALGTIALALALIVWRHVAGWPGLFATPGPEGRAMRQLLAFCLIAPIAIALIKLWAFRHGTASPYLISMIELVTNILISVGLLGWAWSRIGREISARSRLKRALDSTPMILADAEGRVLLWSEGCEHLYHRSAADAAGQNKHALLRATPEGRWQRIAARLDQGHASEEEIVERRADGTELHILEHALPLRGDAGQPPMVVLSMTDITARKQTEAALRTSDVQLALAVETSGIGVFEWEVAEDRLLLSPEAQKLSRLTPGEIAGGMEAWRTHLESLFRSECLPRRPEIEAKRLPEFAFRLRAEHPGTPPYVIEGAARCLYTPEGALSNVTGVMFDASEREHRAAALQARESELSSILETAPDAVITIDASGRIRSVNSTAETLFGHPAETLHGRDTRMLVPPRFHAAHDALLRACIETDETGPGARSHILTALRADGVEFPVELSIGQVRLAGERFFTGFVRDVSAQLAARARLGEMREELLHVSRLSAMGEMAAGLAHELNQPLAAAANFLGAADMLLAAGDARPEQVRELVTLASTQTLRAGEIIQRVRAFASKGTVQILREPLAEVIADAVALAMSHAERQRIPIDYALAENPAFILADRIQIQQVLVNLIRNAIEAMTPLPMRENRIRIESRGLADAMIEIAVHDNGPGLDDHIIGRRHQPFVSTKANGMGIGLSICRRIVEAHGGRLSVENRSEGGATVRFTLPEAVAETVTERAEQPA